MKKHEILEAIRRTAEANGGVPLGTDRLTRLGITPAVWGRYWPRLSAAQREAGLTPNKAREAFPVEEALAKLAALARELGSFPIDRERVLKRRQDPSFPSERVFKRIGSKAHVAARLAEYARGRPELEDVVAMCRAGTVDVEPAPGATGAVTFGTVYLVKGRGREYKIGRTNAFGRRAREFKLQLPFETRKVHVITTDDPEGVEAYWHRRFEAKRMNSEWFKLDEADVAAFKRWKRIA
jgi:hypothetical protein